MIFKFFIGGYFGGYFELVYSKKHVSCFMSDYPVRPPEPTKVFCILDDPEWEIFLQYLKKIKWNAIYSSEICDGIQWSLQFKYGDLKIKSEGSNNYPRGFKTLIYLLNKTTRKHGILTKL